MTGAVTAVADALSRSCGDEPAHLVGLSLGARVGLKLAAERNAASLALLGCGLTFRGGAQLAAIRALPAVFFRGGPDKAGKAALTASMIELAALDLRPSLAAVSTRTLVVCGEKDKPYLADSREIAATIPGAQLRLIRALAICGRCSASMTSSSWSPAGLTVPEFRARAPPRHLARLMVGRCLGTALSWCRACPGRSAVRCRLVGDGYHAGESMGRPAAWAASSRLLS